MTTRTSSNCGIPSSTKTTSTWSWNMPKMGIYSTIKTKKLPSPKAKLSNSSCKPSKVSVICTKMIYSTATSKYAPSYPSPKTSSSTPISTSNSATLAGAPTKSTTKKTLFAAPTSTCPPKWSSAASTTTESTSGPWEYCSTRCCTETPRSKGNLRSRWSRKCYGDRTISAAKYQIRGKIYWWASWSSTRRTAFQ